MSSASSTARLIDCTVLSMLTTTPFLKPCDGCVPMPMISTAVAVGTPTMAQILVVPISRPTMNSSFLPILSPPFLKPDHDAVRAFVQDILHRQAPCRHTLPDLFQAPYLELHFSSVHMDHRPPLHHEYGQIADLTQLYLGNPLFGEVGLIAHLPDEPEGLFDEVLPLALSPLVCLPSGHDRVVERLAWCGLLKGGAVFIDVVELIEADQGDGVPLYDLQGHVVRQDPTHCARSDPGKPLDPLGDLLA